MENSTEKLWFELISIHDCGQSGKWIFWTSVRGPSFLPGLFIFSFCGRILIATKSCLPDVSLSKPPAALTHKRGPGVSCLQKVSASSDASWLVNPGPSVPACKAQTVMKFWHGHRFLPCLTSEYLC